MFKKSSAFIFVLFSVFFLFGGAARAQESEAAANSALTGVALPAGAERILPQSVPAEITQVFDKIIAAGGGKLRKGDTEVLAWAGANYKKANASAMINRLTATLKNAGWQYSIEGEESGMTVFAAVKEGAPRRAIIGFHGATDDALVFAWMEVLSANGDAGDNQKVEDETPQTVNSPASNAAHGSVIGTWGNGSTAMMGEKYQNGTIASRGGSTFKYVFHPNGAFEFVGYMESTLYGCTTSIFQDKRGKYSIKGNQITLNLTKNFWRNQYSCSPASNKERNYTLTPETYTFRIKRNDYGRDEICLTGEKAEACYERRQD